MQVYNKLPAPEAIKIKLCHRKGASETSVLREREALFGDLNCISIYRRMVLCAPQAVAFDLERLGKAGHIEIKRPSRFRPVRIQRQIDLSSPH